ncbi:MAG: PRC-barrel domain-containing protein [Desulfobacterales bacterium]
MLRSLKELYNYVLSAEDGDIGRCKDFLFDDRFWTIRYMVADTAKWLPGKKVLISPISLASPDWRSRRLPVKLTKDRIKGAPELDEDAPVSRQHEIRWTKYYGWPFYWQGPGAWGYVDYPYSMYVQRQVQENVQHREEETEKHERDQHLRSAREVTGYHIQAVDTDIGHVEDFILDDETWTIRYMVVDTRNFLPGRNVLITPDWIESVDWALSEVSVDVPAEAVKNSPPYDPKIPVNREYEVRLYDYYGRPVYWRE